MSSYKRSQLNIFPIKSLRGIPLNTARLSSGGFEYDRQWMLIDSQGRFITQRQQALLSLVDVSLTPDSLLVNAPGKTALSIPFNEGESKPVEVIVWRDHCSGIVASGPINQWFSEYSGVDCRLVRFDTTRPRRVDPVYKLGHSDQVLFADGFPFLLIGTASLEDLNQRMAKKNEPALPMMRFRPNIVVETDVPFIEDQWTGIRIGEVEMRIVKPCSRCVIPTIDFNTGKKSKEPLTTLGEYRKRNGKIYFGQNVIHRYRPEQSISTGDTLVVQ